MKPAHSSTWLICFLLLLSFNTIQAQIVITDDVTAEELATSLLGSGVTISGVELTCEDGGYSLFECIDCNVGLSSGILLTSGSASFAEGPNDESSSTGGSGGPGDPDLDDISGYITYDACILEFDVNVTSDTLKFNFVFGSEEYTTYVNSSVNDAFGLFISGPGITGLENLALIPGTSTGISINTVNPLEYEEYYIDNGVGCTPSFGGCTEGFLTSPYTDDEYYIGYDGFTVVMEAKSAVIPCETYHLKLAIADAGDGALDSGVFIEAGSLTSPGIVVDVAPTIEGYPYLIEECVEGFFTVELSFAPIDTFVAYFIVSGTAIGGADYTALPDSIIFYPGDTLATFPIEVFNDGIFEGEEFIIIALEFGCSADLSDSIIVSIFDDIPLEVTPIVTTICSGTSVTLTATGAVSYAWSPGATLSVTDSAVTIASPSTSTLYTITGVVGTCTKTISVPVNVSPPPTIITSGNQAICIGDAISLFASGGVDYTWSPTSSLDEPLTATPTADPTTTTTYNVVVADEFGCTSTDDLTITVNPLPNAFASPDTLVCYGAEVQLFSSGGVSYLWSPTEYLSDATIANPIFTTYASTLLTVTVTDANGCVNSAEAFIELDPVPVAFAGLDSIIYLGETAFLSGSGGGDFFWSPTDGLSNPESLTTFATPLLTTTYTLTVLSEAGCLSSDDVTIFITDIPLVVFPNAFSPNSDGINDFYNWISRGDIASLQFYIYNRWGQIMYQSNTPLPSGGWDGTIQGNEQEMGTYVYLLSFTDLLGRAYNYQGNFTLSR